MLTTFESLFFGKSLFVGAMLQGLWAVGLAGGWKFRELHPKQHILGVHNAVGKFEKTGFPKGSVQIGTQLEPELAVRGALNPGSPRYCPGGKFRRD